MTLRYDDIHLKAIRDTLGGHLGGMWLICTSGLRMGCTGESAGFHLELSGPGTNPTLVYTNPTLMHVNPTLIQVIDLKKVS